MEVTNREDDVAPLQLMECGLEELLAALLGKQPIVTSTEGELFALENDEAPVRRRCLVKSP